MLNSKNFPIFVELLGPVAPVAPVSPVAPVGPVSPQAGPVGPIIPVGPVAPRIPPASETVIVPTNEGWGEQTYCKEFGEEYGTENVTLSVPLP